MRNGFGAPCVNDASSCILTCRRSASLRATGLGTGTEVAAGAPPSPVRPLSSFSEPRERDRNHRKPHLHAEEVESPKPTPFLFPRLFKTDINNEHIDTAHGIVFVLSPKQKKKINLFRFWQPSNCCFTFLPAEATGRGCSSVCA